MKNLVCFLLSLCVLNPWISAEPVDLKERPAGWEIHTRGGEVLEALSLRTEKRDLWLDGEGERRLPLAEVAGVVFRPERTLLPLPEISDPLVWDGSETARVSIPLPMEKSVRMRLRVAQEEGVGWGLVARRVTRGEQGTSERPELVIRQSSEGLDIRDWATRHNRRVRGDAPAIGVATEFEIMTNWDPPMFAVWREGVPIYVSEQPGIEARDIRREFILILREGSKTVMSQIELSRGDGQLPELRAPRAEPAPPAPGSIRIFFTNHDHADVAGLRWEENQIAFRMTEEGSWIRVPSERVRMVLYAE